MLKLETKYTRQEMPSTMAAPLPIENDFLKMPKDLTYLAFASAWSSTAISIISQSFSSNLTWPCTFINLSVLPINWVIFPFKPHDGLTDFSKETSEKIYHITAFSFGAIATIALTTYSPLTNTFSSITANPVPSARIVVALTNLIACAILYSRFAYLHKFEPFQVMKKAAKCFLNAISSIKIRKESNLNHEKEEQLKRITKSTEAIRQRNKIAKSNFRELEKFIDDDDDLKASFEECYSKSKDIMCAPSRPQRIDSGSPNKNSRRIINEWGKAQLETIFLESMEQWLIDFLELNPAFVELLVKKIQKVETEQQRRLLGYLPESFKEHVL